MSDDAIKIDDSMTPAVLWSLEVSDKDLVLLTIFDDRGSAEVELSKKLALHLANELTRHAQKWHRLPSGNLNDS